MRSPRVRLVLRALSVALFVVLLATLLVRFLGVPLGLVALVLALASWLFLPESSTDAEACDSCGHLRVDHHGICQECLRMKQRADDTAPEHSCWRFRRSAAAREAPWRRLRSTGVSRSG